MGDSVKRRTGETVEDFEERAILSRRRAVIFNFLIGLLVITLIFFIRIDIDAEKNRLGTTMRLVEKTSPVFLGTVKIALADVAEEEEEGERPMRAGDEGSESGAASYLQRHPRELLKRLFGCALVDNKASFNYM